MSKLLYRLGVYMYTFGIYIASFFNKKARFWVNGRKGIIKNIQNFFSSNVDPIIWIHCASLGEFEQGRPIIEAIKKQQPQYKILLTFFSPSGYEIRKDYEHADSVFYLPVDTPTNAQKFIEAVQPKIVIFVKYEFWYHYLTQLSDKNIPTYLISAIFRSDQLFFKWYGSLFKEMLLTFDHIFVQNDYSKKLLKSISYSNCTVSGDTRLDRVMAIKLQSKKYPIIDKFCSNSKILVCGSTWPQDESVIEEFAKTQNSFKLIIAPHQVDKKHLTQIKKTFEHHNPLFYSQNPSTENLKDASIIIIDNIGMLSFLYAYADIAYIGGGFSDGIHNTLEAVVYNIPILFGKNYDKFEEAKTLIKQEIAYEIRTAKDIAQITKQLLSEKRKKTITEKCSNYLKQNSGATDIILSYLKEKL
ncbi:3-deoxy-D-manno-octulosonic acid transferase [Aureispira]|nr:3-deoxy-D-manno-octulosonic acid transferase [Aureispira sp.]